LWKAGKQRELEAAENEQLQANVRTPSSMKMVSYQGLCLGQSSVPARTGLHVHMYTAWSDTTASGRGSMHVPTWIELNELNMPMPSTQTSTIASHALNYFASKSSWES
jgi:hypothetical protein